MQRAVSPEGGGERDPRVVRGGKQGKAGIEKGEEGKEERKESTQEGRREN